MNGVLHIGIDAATFRLLDGMAARGLMPAYAALKEAAAHGLLRSTIPWFTVPGWISLMTGVPARGHGLIHWTTVRPADLWDPEAPRGRLVSARDVPHPTIFRLASDAGLRVASVNMPVTHPPEPLNGVMVSGFMGPTDPRRAVHPPGFLDAYPGYEVDVEAGPGAVRTRLSPRLVRRYSGRLGEAALLRARIGADLMASGHDLVSVVFVGPDRLLHVAWPAVDAALRGEDGAPGARAAAAYYRDLDRALETLLDAAGDRLVLVTSDHGQGPPPGRLVAVNTWLEGRGLLEAAGGRSARRVAVSLVPGWAQRSAWAALRRLRRRPAAAPPLVRWDRTLAYAMRFPHCGIFGIALARPDDGLAADVAAALTELRDPETGRPLVTMAFRSDRFTWGPGRERFPDVMAVLYRGWEATSGLDGGPVFRPERGRASGSHEVDGILLARGPGIVPGRREHRAIWEVAPTILAAFGVPIPPHVTSEPIGWALPEMVPATAAARAGGSPPGDGEGVWSAAPGDEAPLSSEEEEAVSRHLQDLGYLD
ncbi:MAG: alkaline phosphatase family protein [Actinobacteria bacterium]|nr:alkaline phosphatase family protein [Actinomycetota bacterium]